MTLRPLLPLAALLGCLVLPATAQEADPYVGDGPACTATGYIDPSRKISDDFVALRLHPSSRAPLLARMGYGTRFAVCGRSGSWTLLQLDNGQTGYAFSKLLRIEALPLRTSRSASVGRETENDEYEPMVTQDMLDEQAAVATRRRQAQELLMLGMIGALMGGGGGSSSASSDDTMRRYPGTASSSEPDAPTYTAPVGGENGLYGSAHGVGD